MRCPNGDGNLIHHDETSEGLKTPFDICPTCMGVWISSFAANHIDSRLLPKPPAVSHQQTPVPICPTCESPLSRLRGETVPPGTIGYRCLEGHGFYFPLKDLLRFRQASEVRIHYHSLWRLPLPALSRVILASFILAVTASGLIASLHAVRTRQQTILNAQDIIRSQRAIVGDSNHVLFIVTTSKNTKVFMSIPKAEIINQQLISRDGVQHTLTLTLPFDTYEYFYSIDNTLKSPTYTVRVIK